MSSAIAQRDASQLGNAAATPLSSCQSDDSRPWLEAQRNQRQTQFLLCAAAGIALVAILTWLLPAPSGEAEESGGVTFAILVILAGFVLVVLTGMDALGRRADGRGFALFLLCMAAALPHLIAVFFVLASVNSIPTGISKTRAFVAGLGLLAPILFVLIFVIDNDWDFSKLRF